jgi:hypothetical protein
MLIYDLFKPAAHDGVIVRLKQSPDAAYRPFQWNPQTRSWIRSDVAIDRFMTLPPATTSELWAAGLSFSDVKDE